MSAAPRYVSAVCKARDLILELQIESPSEIAIDKIAAYKKAPIRYAKLDGCDGRMVRSGENAIITVSSAISRVGQKRFVIAHELGHVLLHPEIRQIDEVDSKQLSNFNHNQGVEELEANYFAAEVLMPKKLLNPFVQNAEPGWKTIGEIADTFQTTLSSSAIQFAHCTKEAVIVVASDAGDRKWFVFSETARDFFLSSSSRIHKYSCAQQLFDDGITSSRASDVPAGAWLDGFDPNGKECLTEDSIRAKGSTFVLTLIWINEDI